jgi:hypothetical protein
LGHLFEPCKFVWIGEAFLIGVGMTRFENALQHNLGLGGAAVVTMYRKESSLGGGSVGSMTTKSTKG